nr:hypothetical protein [Tanacetum cinerariifolium]
VEHKNHKRSNEMNYPRVTKVIIDYFMTRKPSISRRNKINWHYVRDDALFSTIKVMKELVLNQGFWMYHLMTRRKNFRGHGSGTDEGTGSKPGVPDVPSDDSEEEISWNSSDDEDVGGHEE